MNSISAIEPRNWLAEQVRKKREKIALFKWLKLMDAANPDLEDDINALTPRPCNP